MANNKNYIFKVLALFLVATIFVCCDKNTINELYVELGDNLDKEKLVIERGNYSINSVNDSNLVKNGLEQRIYFESSAYPFENTFGENDFLVVYNKQYYGIIRHYILSDFYSDIPKAHQYYFNFSKKDSIVFLNLQVKGEFPGQYNIELKPTLLAESLIWTQELPLKK